MTSLFFNDKLFLSFVIWTTMNQKTAIESAVRLAGGQAALARSLRIRPQAVQQWVATGNVPAKRVLRIEALTGVSRSELRPDLYPQEQAA